METAQSILRVKEDPTTRVTMAASFRTTKLRGIKQPLVMSTGFVGQEFEQIISAP